MIKADYQNHLLMRHSTYLTILVMNILRFILSMIYPQDCTDFITLTHSSIFTNPIYLIYHRRMIRDIYASVTTDIMGAINMRGEKVIGFLYDEPITYYHDVAIVKTNEKYGVISPLGEDILQTKYGNIKVYDHVIAANTGTGNIGGIGI